jgi:hypothetical protein
MMINVGIRIGGLSLSQGIDPDASAYFATAGITDATAKVQINLFVKGVKNLGLWSSIASWPLRSTQNAGTGTTAYSLGGLGTFNGTLVSGPTWGTDGIIFDGVNDVITTSLTTQFTDFAAMATVNVNALSGAASRIIDKNFANGFWLGKAFTPNQAGGGVKETGSPFGRYVAAQEGIFNTLFSTRGGTTHSIYKNGSSTVATGTVTSSALSADSVSFGGSSNFLTGTISFTLISNQSFSGGVVDSLYTLYKTTLGDGLGLP